MTYNVVVGTALSFYFILSSLAAQSRAMLSASAIAITMGASPELPAVPPNSVCLFFEFYRFSFHQFGYYQHLAVSGFGRPEDCCFCS